MLYPDPTSRLLYTVRWPVQYRCSTVQELRIPEKHRTSSRCQSLRPPRGPASPVLYSHPILSHPTQSQRNPKKPLPRTRIPSHSVQSQPSQCTPSRPDCSSERVSPIWRAKYASPRSNQASIASFARRARCPQPRLSSARLALAATLAYGWRMQDARRRRPIRLHSTGASQGLLCSRYRLLHACASDQTWGWA